jgi:hypothetical protein
MSTLAIVKGEDGEITVFLKGPAAKLPLTCYLAEDDAYGDITASEVSVETWAEMPAKAKRAVKDAAE